MYYVLPEALTVYPPLAAPEATGAGMTDTSQVFLKHYESWKIKRPDHPILMTIPGYCKKALVKNTAISARVTTPPGQ
jgi:hypothetical protein